MYISKSVDPGTIKQEIEEATQKRCIISVTEDKSLEGIHAPIYAETTNR
jgi:hypothetical protein